MSVKSKSESLDLIQDGPKTRSKLKVSQSTNEEFHEDSPELLNNKKKRMKRRKFHDESSDGTSDCSDEDFQYVIDGDPLSKKIKVRYFDEFGIEDEIKEMKDITFKKDSYTVVRISNKSKNHRSRNVDVCVTCDESGEGLLTCVRCPASFHPSCIAGCLPSKKNIAEPWFCRRCRYESNVMHKQRRIPKILPFDEDYCDTSWHLHCLEVPMTAVLNEFWMCPLHGEAAIDRFVLNNAAITNRMFYWNRCRSKIKAKKLFKNFIKGFLSTTTESVEELFGNVPFIVDNKNICLSLKFF